MLQQGCVEIVESSMGAKVTETEERMCGSIYNEAVSEVKDGRVQQMKQDLFMEQRQWLLSFSFLFSYHANKQTYERKQESKRAN